MPLSGQDELLRCEVPPGRERLRSREDNITVQEVDARRILRKYYGGSLRLWHVLSAWVYASYWADIR